MINTVANNVLWNFANYGVKVIFKPFRQSNKNDNRSKLSRKLRIARKILRHSPNQTVANHLSKPLRGIHQLQFMTFSNVFFNEITFQ